MPTATPDLGSRYATAVPLSSGATAEVYRAYDARLDRPVALKLLRNDDPALVARLLREARAQARVQHPGICEIYEIGTLNGRPFIAMALVDGVDLHAAAPDLRTAEKVEIVRLAAEAIHAAHGVGLVHRDLKPANIMIARDAAGAPAPQIVDFGLVRDAQTHTMTEPGQWLGTPAFMAPEQARGERDAEGPPSDVYALGATLYFLLAGRPPFDRASAHETLDAVLHARPTPLRQHAPAVAPDLARIVRTCLRKDPADRYATADALARDLAR
ncbi:MAG: serine/threonine-protein kinase, partial [Acidobacteriota bacterium]